jgi:ribosome-binding factor A
MADRDRRLAERIREIVATTLERRVKDPRLGMVTVTDARLTPDLRAATVYYTVYGGDDDRDSTAAALDSAKGVLRAAVGRELSLRHTPSLAFVHDALPEHARHVDELIARAHVADERLHAAAEGALPAGGPDPYRHLPEDE